MSKKLEIFFDEKHHRYYDSLGRDYLSVTRFIHRDEPPFDAKATAQAVVKNKNSKYYGMNVEAVIKKWNSSAPLGTELHGAMEEYIKSGTITDHKDLKPLVEQFAKLKFTGKLHSEIVVFDPDYLIAGTIDILEEVDDVYWLFDIKTSVTRPNSDKMDATKLNTYSKQLEIYKRLVEKQFNKPCNIGGILWFRDYANRLEHTKLKFLQTKDATFEVDGMLHRRAQELSTKSNK
jgi:hypothetical protein